MSSVSSVRDTTAVHDVDTSDTTPATASPKEAGTSSVQAYSGPKPESTEQAPQSNAGNPLLALFGMGGNQQAMNFGFVLGKVFELLGGLLAGDGGGGASKLNAGNLGDLWNGVTQHKKKGAKDGLDSVDQNDQKTETTDKTHSKSGHHAKSAGDAKSSDKSTDTKSTDTDTKSTDTADTKEANDTPPSDDTDPVDDSAGAGDVISDQVGDDSSVLV